jgi:hypothetical protein
VAEKEKKVKEKKVKSPVKAGKEAPASETKAKSSAKAKTAAAEPLAKAPKAVKASKAKKVSEPITSSGPQRLPSKAKSAQATTPAPSHHEIAQLAHRFWKERGGHHGSHNQDWLRAEHELRGKAS